MDSGSFLWNCPLLLCNEKFASAKLRLAHLKQYHWVDLRSGESDLWYLDDGTYLSEPGLLTKSATSEEEATMTNMFNMSDQIEDIEAFYRQPQQLALYQGANPFTVTIGKKDEGQIELMVSSEALALASPVWKAMVQGGYKEAVTGQVYFPEDDLDSMLLLLSISQLSLQNIPEAMDFDQLRRLAEVCYKYDCARVVIPWVRNWMKPFHIPKLHSLNARWHLMDVAWVFGDIKTVNDIYQYLLLHAIHGSKPGSLRCLEKELDFRIPCLQEYVLDRREQFIKELFDAGEEYLTSLVEIKPTKYRKIKYKLCQECQQAECTEEQEQVFRRNIEAERITLWPQLLPWNRHDPLRKLIKSLSSLQGRYYGGTLLTISRPHHEWEENKLRGQGWCRSFEPSSWNVDSTETCWLKDDDDEEEEEKTWEDEEPQMERHCPAAKERWGTFRTKVDDAIARPRLAPHLAHRLLETNPEEAGASGTVETPGLKLWRILLLCWSETREYRQKSLISTFSCGTVPIS
ncbi:hypothetical protein BT63DRAFT_476549 [Microthyrium microscopicum]|uniref:C2H2-type domain-containing protein n=1 Tax=Microthyrium microscopicum TaxID=703497 RepID=A0A6A6UJL6_9PEZI|nr:hypothetical protein BT63DRAFT_476549 [Microthyrium microscopicum]